MLCGRHLSVTRAAAYSASSFRAAADATYVAVDNDSRQAPFYWQPQ
jgi:hypothetical protein